MKHGIFITQLKKTLLAKPKVEDLSFQIIEEQWNNKPFNTIWSTTCTKYELFYSTQSTSLFIFPRHSSWCLNTQYNTLLLTVPLPAETQGFSIAASPQWQATFSQSAGLTWTCICSHKILRTFQMRSLQVSPALKMGVLLFPGIKGNQRKISKATDFKVEGVELNIQQCYPGT